MHRTIWRRRGMRMCLLSILFGVFLFAAGCANAVQAYTEWKAQAIETDAAAAQDAGDGTAVSISGEDAFPVRDNALLYEKDIDDSVVTMYMTVSEGSAANNTDHTWAEINAYSVYDYEAMGVERYSCEALLQIGDDTGLLPGELGFGQAAPNGTVKIRGASTSRAAQKSYKITLRDGAGEWRQQRAIALNKHIYDKTRFINKLAYDLMEPIPELIGQRTQFVHLYVRDLTGGDADAEFLDYGLFTQIEQPNGRYLRNHGFESQGQLYQVQAFAFQQNDALRLSTDPKYDVTAFEKLLEIKGSNDHTKLLAMIDAVNDQRQPIETTFEKYFDAENYFSWLAFNILIGNTDSQQSNLYLYSPTASEKWYFVCWDCDGGFSRYINKYIDIDAEDGHDKGIANYWDSVLHRRVMTIPAYRERLDEKIQQLRAYMTPERIRTLIDGYRPIIKKYLFSTPDNAYSRVTEAQWEEIFEQIPNEVEWNYKLYQETLKTPMPFWQGTPERTADGKTRFMWDAAYDFDGENVTYSFKLGRSYLFEEIIAQADGLQLPQYIYDGTLAPGDYYCWVEAKNASGYTQLAFEYYVDARSRRTNGVMQFHVADDGEMTIVAHDRLRGK